MLPLFAIFFPKVKNLLIETHDLCCAGFTLAILQFFMIQLSFNMAFILTFSWQGKISSMIKVIKFNYWP